MEKYSKEELIRQMENEIKKLPEKAQNAIYWMMENFEIVMEMCKESDMTDEEIEKYRKIAKEKDDYIALVLLCAAVIYKNNVSKKKDNKTDDPGSETTG